MRQTFAWMVALALIALSSSAFAQSSRDLSRASGDYRVTPQHRPGFMARYTVGASYARTGQTLDLPGDDDPRITLSGPAVDMSGAVGVALSSGFAVHGSVLYWRAFNPNVEVSGSGGSLSIDTDDTTLQMLGVGGGFTTWFANNTYFSASLTATQLRSQNGDTSEETNWGIGGEGLLGHEWWVGTNVGIGFAAAATWHVIADSDDDEKALTGFSAGGRLSLTFN